MTKTNGARYRIGLTALALAVTTTAASADDSVGGGPRADFLDDTFSIPCVQVDNLAPQHDGQYYDVVLERRGNSFNFELVLAEAEDPAYCQRLADFSRYEDGDYGNDDDNEDDTNGNAMLVSCELRADRSSISIEARELDTDQYFVLVESGDIPVQGQPRETTGGEVEFNLDSNPVEIAKGATPLVAHYLEAEKSVYAELVNENTGVTVASATALCAVI